MEYNDFAAKKNKKKVSLYNLLDTFVYVIKLIHFP